MQSATAQLQSDHSIEHKMVSDDFTEKTKMNTHNSQ